MRFTFVPLAVALLLGIAACGEGTTSSSDSAGASALEDRKADAKAEADSPQVAEAGGGDIVVPNVVGMDHQAAQDVMQGEGLWILDEEDCTGQGRMLLFDRNWEVVRTDPPAGTAVTADTTITLCSKKEGE